MLIDKIIDYTKKNVKQAIVLETEGTVVPDNTLGLSKFEGNPDLPKGFIWPYAVNPLMYEIGDNKEYPLSFIAQIDLKEASKYDSTSLLPKTGYLYFFFGPFSDCYIESPEYKECIKVFHIDCTADELVPTPRPAGSALNEIVEQGVSSEDKFIRFYSAPSYPYHWVDDDEFMTNLSHDEFSEYVRDDGEMTAELQKHFEGYDLMYDQIFGNANYIQFVDPKSRCVSAYRSLYGVDTTEDEWIVLLQYLYNPHRVHFIFCIHKNDLKKGRFDRVFAITEFD